MSKFSVPGPLFLAHQDVIRLRPYVDARPKHTDSLRGAALKPGVWFDVTKAAGFGYIPWGPQPGGWTYPHQYMTPGEAQTRRLLKHSYGWLDPNKEIYTRSNHNDDAKNKATRQED